MWQGIKDKAKHLITKHGTEVGAIAKVAAHALVPGAPLLVSAVEAACDYSADKAAEANDEALGQMLESLGGDVAQLEIILGHLGGQLDMVITQMVQMAQFGTPPQALEAMVNTALETQHQALRDELRALMPEFETVKRQQAQMLRQQALQGDMLGQVQETLDAALAFNAPLAGEGVVGPQVSVFLGARGRFQSALLNGDLAGAETALNEMKAISPNGNTYRVSLMAFKAAKKDFNGAEQVAKTIVGAGANNPRLQRARQSLTSLTQARGSRENQKGTQQVRQPIMASFTPPPKIEPGARIGDKGWTLEALIGRGGMGEVWLAKNLRGRKGALKLMSDELTNQAGFVDRFQAEIDALEQVRHPAVVDVTDWGRVEGVGWYFVMPYVEGQSLRSSLRRKEYTQVDSMVLIQALAEGLAACHAEGIVHRDVKPDNILIRPQGQPVLIDFGIAHQEGLSTGETQMATGGYAPPEQLAGRGVDYTADLYALGVVWVECLGGWDKVPSDWLSLIESLTHNHPSRRGTAESLIKTLKELGQRKSAESKVKPAPRVNPQANDRSRVPRYQNPHKPNSSSAIASLPAPRVNPQANDRSRVPRYQNPHKPNSSSAIASLPSWKNTRLKGTVVLNNGFLGFGKKTSNYQVTCQTQTFNVAGASFKMVQIPNQSYSLSQTQVTQLLYKAVMGNNPSNFEGDQLPVECVSWEDGIAFCNALSKKLGLTPAYKGTDNNCELVSGANGFRLPFEAEWEFAAKGGQNFKYAGSDNIDEVAWYGAYSDGNVTNRQTQPVAQLKPNSYGLYDMSGNVCEWCADDYYNPGQHRLGASKRAYRGGDWSYSADIYMVSCRGGDSPDYRHHLFGLRLSRSLG